MTATLLNILKQVSLVYISMIIYTVTNVKTLWIKLFAKCCGLLVRVMMGHF